jgi:hypothetical protein
MIIGWDIGIKNLAFAKLSVIKGDDARHRVDNENLFTLGNLTFNIELWDAINITDQVNSNNLEDGTLVLPDKHKILCEVEVEKKKTIAPCGKKATHLSSDNKGVCKSHLGRDDTLAYYPITTKPNCIYVLPVDKKHSEPYQCSKKASCVEKDHHYKGYCKKHQPLVQASGVELLTLGRKVNAQHINLTKLGIALYQELDARPELLRELEVVLLENQPVLKNPTMKSVQMFMYSYFIMRGIIQQPDNPIAQVKCYMANNKTKLLTELPEEEQTRIKMELEGVKESYQINKKTSVAIVRYLLDQNVNKKWKLFFEGHCKKDDLADSLLMSIHYTLNSYLR